VAYWEWKNSPNIQTQWLPQKNHGMIMSPVVETMEEAIVDVLIDTDTKQWNNAILEGLFTPQEAEIIKNIPLS